MVTIRKKDGSTEQFQRVKIIVAIRRAGGDEETAKKVADAIEMRAKDGITTKEIRKILIPLLQKMDRKAAGAYMSHKKENIVVACQAS